jgi:hypothetical protein
LEVQAKHRQLRRWDVLWAVYDLSSKWRAMVRRKEKRMEVYRSSLSRCESWMTGESDARLQLLCDSIHSCIDETAEANSMEVLLHHCNFLFLLILASKEEKTSKHKSTEAFAEILLLDTTCWQ